MKKLQGGGITAPKTPVKKEEDERNWNNFKPIHGGSFVKENSPKKKAPMLDFASFNED